MASPLQIIQALAARVSEQKIVPLISPAGKVSFTCLYPEGMKKMLPFNYHIEIEWDEKDRSLYLNANPLKLTMRYWEHCDFFFKEVDQYLKLFFDSKMKLTDQEEQQQEEGEVTYIRPEGTLYVKQNKVGRLVPESECLLHCEEDEDIGERFSKGLSFSCHALHLCRPIFLSLGHKKKPNLAEAFSMLLRGYSEAEVLQEEIDPNLPVISFPSGLFGGKVSSMRPH